VNRLQLNSHLHKLNQLPNQNLPHNLSLLLNLNQQLRLNLLQLP
jgi:hypothetical protein